MSGEGSDRLVDLIYQRIERDFPFPPGLQERWDAGLDEVVAAEGQEAEAAAEARLDALVASEPELRTILQQRARKAASVLAMIDAGASYDVETDSWVRAAE
jgi:hypothetical protein